MGTRQVKVSDISGVELDEKDVVVVTVKDAGKKFDASAEELKALKPVTNVVELEFAYSSGQRSTVLVSKTEFEKLVPKDKLASFDSNRGRRSGTSPLIKSSSNGSAPSGE